MLAALRLLRPRLARPLLAARYSSPAGGSGSSPLPPPEVTGTVPPIRKVTPRKLPKKLKKHHLDVHELQQQNSFLGFSSNATHPSMYNYLLGSAGGQAIIDPEQTMLALRRVLALLKKVTVRGGRTLFVSTQPTLARLTRVIGEQSGQFHLSKRWVPGLLTNWDKGREHVHRMLRLDPAAQSAGKLKMSDLQKANYFRGVEGMTKLPDLIVRLDHTNLYGEPASVNIPLISVVDSNANLKGVDYPIPANTKSLRFYHTFAALVVKACQEGAELRKDLNGLVAPSSRPPEPRRFGPGAARGRLGRGGSGGQRGGQRGEKGSLEREALVNPGYQSPYPID